MNLNNIFYLLQYIKNITLETYNQYKITSDRDLPRGPVAKSQFRGPRFDFWLGNKIPYATKTQHSQKNRFLKIINDRFYIG